MPDQGFTGRFTSKLEVIVIEIDAAVPHVQTTVKSQRKQTQGLVSKKKMAVSPQQFSFQRIEIVCASPG